MVHSNSIWILFEWIIFSPSLALKSFICTCIYQHFAHTYLHTHINTHINIHTYPHTHIHTRKHKHTHTYYSHILTQKHTHTHTYKHVLTRKHKHTRTRTLSQAHLHLIFARIRTQKTYFLTFCTHICSIIKKFHCCVHR